MFAACVRTPVNVKRRYKQGDWFAVPLGPRRAALGIVAFADRSRLFGYFFEAPNGAASADALRALDPGRALLATHFGGAPLEERRWPIVATSLAFEQTKWPYAPQREPYATAAQVEALLLGALDAAGRQDPFEVRELRPPLEWAQLCDLGPGARIQLREPPSPADCALLATLLQSRGDLELRLHGSIDLASLAGVSGEVRTLTLDAIDPCAQPPLEAFEQLRALHVGRTSGDVDLRALTRLPHLRVLRLEGPHAQVGVLRELHALEELELSATRPFRIADLGSAPLLRRLVLRHSPYDLDGIGALERLQTLELRDLYLERLPDLSRNVHLRTVRLHGVRGLRDLRALKTAALESVSIEAMPQIEIGDFAQLLPWEPLPAISIEIGSRSKSREIYRMLSGARRAGRA